MSKTPSRNKQTLFFPFTDIPILPKHLYVIGSRPGMGRTQYIFWLIQENTEVLNKEETAYMGYFYMQALPILKHNIPSLESGVVVRPLMGLNTENFGKKLNSDINAFTPSCVIVDGFEKIIHPFNYSRTKNETHELLIEKLRETCNLREIPIIITTQLSRSTEKIGGNNRPNMLHHFSSKSIEKNADVVISLYRPFYYGFTEDETGTDIRNRVEVIALKNCFGKTKTYCTDNTSWQSH